MPMFTSVQTAGGKRHNVLGSVEVPVTYQDKTKTIIFYVCPDLIQIAYLGVDFWRAFELAPQIFTVDEINPEKLTEDFPLELDKVERHNFSETKKLKMERVKFL